MKSKAFLIVIIASFLLRVGAQAAWLDPNLEQELSLTASNEYVRCFFTLRDTVNHSALLDDIYAKKLTLAKRHYRVIIELQEKAAMTQAPVIEMLQAAMRSGEVREFRSYWISNAITVWAKPSFYFQLAEHPAIDKIYFPYPIENIAPVEQPTIASGDRAATGIEPGIAMTRAPELWAMGIDGSTALAGDCDTGADGNHAAFGSRWRGHDPGVDHTAAWFDPVTLTEFPFDAAYHGTHTLGTIVGDDGGGNQIGMAPGAKWIAAGTVDRVSIQQTIDDSILAFQWFADPDGNPATMDDVPDVINNSWGISPLYHGVPYCDEQMWAAIDGAEAAGAVVLFAAGNEGPGEMTTRTPSDRIATDLNVFSIGSLEQGGETISSFSSRGPSGCDELTIKPEVSAVGSDVRSSMPGDSYGLLSGTSMATPHVAGAVVLLRDAYPEATPEDIKFALYETAVDLGEAGEDNNFGRGRIDVVEAYLFLMNYLVSSDGEIHIDPLFHCDDVIEITVKDADLTGPTLDAKVSSNSMLAGRVVTLDQTDTPGIYIGSIEMTESTEPGKLRVSHGDGILTTYIDANDGQGGFNVSKTDEADVDCQAPVFTGLTGALPGDGQVDLSWDLASDDNDFVYNIYRSEASGGQDFDAPITQTDSPLFIDYSVINYQQYFYVVRAEDVLGHEDDNLVELDATPIGPVVIFFEDFESDGMAEWTLVDGGTSNDTWVDTNPEGRYSEWWQGKFAIVDRDAAGFFANLDEQLITPVIDLGHYRQVVLSFFHEFEKGFFEYAQVDYSYDGQNWTNLANYRDDAGGEQTFQLPDWERQSEFYVRFYYPSGGNLAMYWGVDTVTLTGLPIPTTTTTSTTTTTTTTSTTTTTLPPTDDDADDDSDDDWLPPDDDANDDQAPPFHLGDSGDDDKPMDSDDDDDSGCGC